MKIRVALSISFSTFRDIRRVAIHVLGSQLFLAGSPEIDPEPELSFPESISVGECL
jgi:hypothetical protein